MRFPTMPSRNPATWCAPMPARCCRPTSRARWVRPPDVPSYMPKPKNAPGPAAADPAFAALVALYPRVTDDLQKEFVALLNDRRDRVGFARKPPWTDLLRRCGQNPSEP